MVISDQSVREIVISEPAAMSIFEELGIDYCCNGRRKLSQACAEANVDIESVLGQLENLPKSKDGKTDARRNLNAPELVDHIVLKHHTYTREAIGRLTILIEKVLRHHGENHPELETVSRLFDELKSELTPHMQKEEFVLFPYINELFERRETGGQLSLRPFGTVQNPIRQMMIDHDQAGELLAQIRAATANFTLPKDACMSFEAMYAGLRELELDLHQHVHMENNILFPLAISIEREILLGVPELEGAAA